MSNVVVGHCPRCGAPVYSPAAWNSILPPPSTPSCGCSLTMQYAPQDPQRPAQTYPAPHLTETDIRRIIREELARSQEQREPKP